MPGPEILRGIPGLCRVRHRYQEIAVLTNHFLRQRRLPGGRAVRIEVRRSALLHADVENRIRSFATDGLDAGVYDAADFGQTIFQVPFGRRKRVATFDPESGQKIVRRKLTQPVKVDFSHLRRLRERRRHREREDWNKSGHVSETARERDSVSTVRIRRWLPLRLRRTGRTAALRPALAALRRRDPAV